MPRAEWDFIGNVVVPIPPKTEQMRIAAFLDQKAAALDTLVANKDRLIGVLGKKRRVLITQVVTKGLDEATAMRNVEGRIGRIPATGRLRD